MKNEMRSPTGTNAQNSSPTVNSTTSDLTNTVKIAIAYGSMGSPLAPYQRVDGDDLASIKSFSSTVSMGKRFTCQFDPGAKNGRSLVLKFDASGTATFQEMSRLEVLRMAQEAAQPALVPDPEDVTSDTDEPDAARKPRRTSVRRLNTHANILDSANFSRSCDVQPVHARDIRKLDNAFSVTNEPSVVVRRQAVLINADPLRAIIMRDACLVFVPDGADSLLSILKEKFRESVSNDPSGDVPYEFKALETLLATLARSFEMDFEKTGPVISSALDQLAKGRTSSTELEKLRNFKNTMNEFESQVDGLRRALMELVDNEEDLRLLYLTKLHQDPSLLNDLWSFDSEEAEILVENYLQDIFSTRTKVGLMQHRIQNTESLVMLKLDSMRNYLLGVDLMFSVMGISIAIGTYVTGVFGMNLNSNLQMRPYLFWIVFALTIAIFIVGVTAGALFAKRKGIFR